MSFWYPGAPADKPALAELDITICQGELVLLCGPSGSGKSTLLRLLLGLVPQFSGGQLAGEIEVLGRDPTLVPPREIAAAGVGLLFQNPIEGFVAERVADEVAFGPENLGVAPAEVDARIAEGLAAVGLEDYARRRLRDLSAGQQQRVAFAAALALRPRLLLLDEPTAHLDEGSAEEVLALVERVYCERGVSVLLSEHRLGLAAPRAGRVLVLADGRLRADGNPRAVFADAAVAESGVPVPRATQAAVRLGASSPVPLTPRELAAWSVRALPPPAMARGQASPPPLEEPATTQDERATLRFERVAFTYPRAATPALSEVSFSLRAGEVAALMGPSGAGKSTLARLALGLVKPSSGRVALGGLFTDHAPLSTLAQVGGLVLQNPLHQLLAERVEDELRLGLRALPAAEADARVERVLQAFGLDSLRERHPLLLSEGQRRRVALAAVLVRQPRVLILDEPTLGQDEHQRAALTSIVRQVAAEGTAVLAISHDAEFVNDACDRLLLLRAGSLVGDLPMDLAYHGPARLADAGAPLADVPATALLLSEQGRPTRARSVAGLVRAMAGA